LPLADDGIIHLTLSGKSPASVSGGKDTGNTLEAGMFSFTVTYPDGKDIIV